MAIEIVSGSVVGRDTGSTTPATFQDYVISASGSGTMLVVLVHNAEKAVSITSVTWNGSEALTLIGSQEGSDYHRVSAYRLLNPTATTANIVTTYNGNPENGSYVVAFLVTGVAVATPVADGVGNSGSAYSSTVTVANCGAADMAVAISGVETSEVSHVTTTGTTLSIGLGANWASTGSAYNTGVGNVAIAFTHNTAEHCIYGFRIVAGGGSDVSLPLTGVSGTASIGAVVLALALSLFGLFGTGAVTGATPGGGVGSGDITIPLTGVSANPAYPISGTQATGSAGTVTVEVGVGSDITIPLTGVSANPAYQLSGVSATGSVGALSPNIEAVDIILPLTGVLGTGSVGEVLYLPLGGWAATGEVGSVAPAVAPPITGNEATAAVGSVGQDRTAGLIGAAANGIAGGWNNIARALTGAEGAEGTGTLAPRSSGAITGNAATTVRGSLVQSHDVAIAGVTGTGRAGYLDTFAPGSVSRPLTGVYATGRIGTMTCIDPSPNYVHVKSRKRILTVQPRHRIITVTRRRF